MSSFQVQADNQRGILSKFAGELLKHINENEAEPFRIVTREEERLWMVEVRVQSGNRCIDIELSHGVRYHFHARLTGAMWSRILATDNRHIGYVSLPSCSASFDRSVQSVARQLRRVVLDPLPEILAEVEAQCKAAEDRYAAERALHMRMVDKSNSCLTLLEEREPGTSRGIACWVPTWLTMQASHDLSSVHIDGSLPTPVAEQLCELLGKYAPPVES
jgi:hypothetical protein